MENIIIIAILAVIVFFSAYYVYRARKSGKKCIGCPDGCSCKNNSACSQSCQDK